MNAKDTMIERYSPEHTEVLLASCLEVLREYLAVHSILHCRTPQDVDLYRRMEQVVKRCHP